MSTAPRVEAAKRDWGHDETGCTVLHIDMDAFYASLEIARHPELKGKPVIIGTGPRSVVSAASYEARRYGINSAMASARARQLCPDGVFLPVDMRYYRMMSRRIFDEVFSRITDRIEQVSVDECYMDVSGALLQWGSPSAIGAWIRAQVAARYHVTCSVGIAANKLVAKMASTNAKPDGMLLIPKARHAEFVQIMPLRGIPGIGPSLERHLNAWGINSVADLAATPETTLAQATGSPTVAHSLVLASHGIDEREVTPYTPEKSIGAERTFTEDTTDMRTVSALLRRCCDEVASTLRKREIVARTITVKLRFDDLTYRTKAHTMERPTDAASVLYPQSVALLKQMLGLAPDAGEDTPLPRRIRLAGASASGLAQAEQTPIQLSIDDLLEQDDAPKGETRASRLRDAEQALDAIRKRYGKGAASIGL
ncbi:MAG TPA: DNA polymerase IV [Bifidobacterium pullorum]|nr:DNA polymerase IV [Bifidobacterium pullorum]